MDVEIMKIARELLASPASRARIIYHDTGRINITALKIELANRRFSNIAVQSMHVPSIIKSNSGKKGWHPLRTASPGRASGARKDPEAKPWGERSWDPISNNTPAKGRMGRV